MELELDAMKSLIIKYKNDNPKASIILYNKDNKDVATIYLSKIDFNDLHLIDVHDVIETDFYLCSYKGINIYFSYYKKVSG